MKGVNIYIMADIRKTKLGVNPVETYDLEIMDAVYTDEDNLGHFKLHPQTNSNNIVMVRSDDKAYQNTAVKPIIDRLVTKLSKTINEITLYDLLSELTPIAFNNGEDLLKADAIDDTTMLDLRDGVFDLNESEIDDNTTSEITTWSSKKIKEYIAAELAKRP